MSIAALLDAFDRQIEWCRVPAPFTARVLERSRAWLHRDNAAGAAFAAVASDPRAAAVPLRWAAALHHLALQGLDPWASLWPPEGTLANVSASQLDEAIELAWTTRRSGMQAALRLPPQTNEVQRSAALLPGLLHVAAATGLPLVLLEIGASAGLNLWSERYRHEHDDWAWGDAQSPLVLRSRWRGPPPPVPAAPLRIARRTACDAQPIALAQPGEGLRLASFIWPEQAERLVRLHTAQAAAARWLVQDGVRVEALAAADFVLREMRDCREGHATVLMHSVVWQYIAPAEQVAVTQAIETAGRTASATRPLAWLRLEPAGHNGDVELRCRLWPGGEDRLLARAHPHCLHIEWLDGTAAT